MSRITDIILVFSNAERTTPIADQGQYYGGYAHEPALRINKWLADNRHLPLRRLDGVATGGEKVFAPPLYIGSFNLLDVYEFINCVRRQEWLWRETVQVFIKCPDDDTFSFVTLADHPLGDNILKDYRGKGF